MSKPQGNLGGGGGKGRNDGRGGAAAVAAKAGGATPQAPVTARGQNTQAETARATDGQAGSVELVEPANIKRGDTPDVVAQKAAAWRVYADTVRSAAHAAKGVWNALQNKPEPDPDAIEAAEVEKTRLYGLADEADAVANAAAEAAKVAGGGGSKGAKAKPDDGLAARRLKAFQDASTKVCDVRIKRQAEVRAIKEAADKGLFALDDLDSELKRTFHHGDWKAMDEAIARIERVAAQQME